MGTTPRIQPRTVSSCCLRHTMSSPSVRSNRQPLHASRTIAGGHRPLLRRGTITITTMGVITIHRQRSYRRLLNERTPPPNHPYQPNVPVPPPLELPPRLAATRDAKSRRMQTRSMMTMTTMGMMTQMVAALVMMTSSKLPLV